MAGCLGRKKDLDDMGGHLTTSFILLQEPQHNLT